MTARPLHLAGLPVYEHGTNLALVLAALMAGYRDRASIASMTGLTDRAVRGAVAHLVADGWPVLSTSSEAGYVFELDPDRLEAVADREYRSRITALAVRWRGARRAAARLRALRDDGASEPIQPGLWAGPFFDLEARAVVASRRSS